MQCPDCKGSGKYIGFRVEESCKACVGTGKCPLPSGDVAYLATDVPVGKLPLLLDVCDLQAKRAPAYARFHFDTLCNLNRVQRSRIFWLYVSHKKLDHSNWVAWNSSSVSRSVALKNFTKYTEYYALYKRITLPLFSSAHDAVYQIITT